MSKFKPHVPMPVELAQYRAKILENRGLHINFPYGIYLPRPGKETHWTQEIPQPFFVGWTMRAFFYAPTESSTEVELRMSCRSGGLTFFATAQIKKTVFYFGFKGINFSAGITPHPKYRIAPPGYYSVAIRYTEGENLAGLFKETEVDFVYERKIPTYPWELEIKGGSHHLLSLHLSDELEKNPNFPTTYFGSKYYMHGPVLDVGSFWIMNCIVIDPNKPLTVYIKLADQNFGQAEYSLANVTRQSEVTIFIRSSRDNWLLSTSFHDKTNQISKKSSQYGQFIFPSVSDNCQIVTQHCEQGAEKYSS